jgi:uncharacterized membrane protein
MFTLMRRYFISGLIILLPLSFTIYFFILAVNFTDGLLGRYLAPIIYQQFGFYFRGLSIIIGVYLIVAIGFFATNIFGRKIYGAFERILLRLPFFSQVYPAIKEISVFLFTRDKISFNQVVLVQYPSKGIYSIGFLTNDSSDKIKKVVHKDLVNVFVPSVPNPLTGYVIMLSRQDVVLTGLSVEEAVKFMVSGGVVNPNSTAGPPGPLDRKSIAPAEPPF